MIRIKTEMGMTQSARTCRICDSEGPFETFSPREMMFGTREAFPYFLCGTCGCLQIEEFPSDTTKYYPSDYYSFTTEAAGGGGLRQMLRRKRDLSAIGKFSVLGKLLSVPAPAPALAAIRRLSIKTDARICDVGCGAGALLHFLRSLGFTSLVGVDPFVEEEVTRPGLEIRRLSLDRLEGQYDVVMFHHSFEHMPDPKGTLATVKRVLAPGGRCLIRVPTVSSWAWEHYQENWVQLDAPRHFFLHSLYSLSILADFAGFEVADMWFDSTSAQFLSELYMAGIPLNEARRGVRETTLQRLLHGAKTVAASIRARRLNAERKGDSVALVITHRRSGGRVSC